MVYGRFGRYIPFVDVRTILTGVSSLISTTSLLPDEAATWASAVRDKHDDFGSKSPTNIDRFNILISPFAFQCLLDCVSRLHCGVGAVSFMIALSRTTCSASGPPDVLQSRSSSIFHRLQSLQIGNDVPDRPKCDEAALKI